MRVLIFGGRKFDDAARMDYELKAFQAQHGRITCVVHGAAAGADAWGEYFAREVLRCFNLPFKADWDNIWAPGAVVKMRRDGTRYNALAGHWRNQAMIDQGCIDWGIGFRGGTGTADMARRLREAGKPIWNAGFEP